MIQQIGKYRILGRLGRGGMGSVYKAYDPVLERAVALKVISAETSVTDDLRRRFFHEAQACARLTHPNIVTVFDLGDADGQLFIVMELLEGSELREIIAAKRALPLTEKLALMTQVCEGLQYAHQKGIVHRDVKPANIFVRPNGQVKILDFGIARIEATDANLTRTGLLVGTLQYIAPERVRGRGDHRADIFSVGAVLYELVTLQSAFPGDDPMQVLEQICTEEPPAPSTIDASLPPELDVIVARALQKDPTRRYDTLARLGGELGALRRRLVEGTEQLVREVQAQTAHVRELEQALTSRVGGNWLDQTRPVFDDRASLPALEALHREFGARIDRLTMLLSRAATLQPAFERGMQALADGDGRTAVAELEHVAEVMPEHARAATALEKARAHYREQHRREQMNMLLVSARNALTVGSYASCADLLQRLAAMSPPTEVAAEATLIQAAAIAAQQEEERRHRERARAGEESRRDERRGADDMTVMLDGAGDDHTVVTDRAPATAGERGRGGGDETIVIDRAPATGEKRAASDDRTIFLGRAAAARDEAQHDQSDATVIMDRLPAAPVEAPSVSGDQTVIIDARPAAPARRFDVTRHARAWLRRRRHPSGRGAIALALTALVLAGVAATALWKMRAPIEAGAGLNELQNAMAAARARAVELEAQTLAPDAFSAAERTAAAATERAGTGPRESGANTYREAAAGYDDAAKQAGAKRAQRAEADSGRAAMVAAKQATRATGEDLRAAQAHEQRGDTEYTGRDFRAAAQSFRSAATLYTKEPPPPATASPAPASPAVPAPVVRATPSPPSPPAPPGDAASPADPAGAVRATLNTYVRAIETKDLALLRRVRPGLDDAELGRWSRSFAITQSRKVQLVFHDIAVDGDRARATGRRDDFVAMADGQRIHTETRFVYTLKRQGEGWVLDELQESRETSPRAR